jgi:hypothetical protein
MMYLDDTCGELWSRSVSGDTNGAVNHPELYFHFSYTQKNLIKKDWKYKADNCVL